MNKRIKVVAHVVGVLPRSGNRVVALTFGGHSTVHVEINAVGMIQGVSCLSPLGQVAAARALIAAGLRPKGAK